MTDQELEITMGRLADMLLDSDNENEKFHISVKGVVLKLYFDMRCAGIKRQSAVKRLTHRSAMKRYFTDKGKTKHAIAVAQYKSALSTYNIELTQWEVKIQKLPLLRRMFAERPKAPTCPAGVEWYIAQSKAKADMPEYLIASAAEFRLIAVPLNIKDVKQEEVKLLAP